MSGKSGSEIKDVITSVNHPLVKEATALSLKKEREAAGLLLVEGVHPIEEALQAGLSVKQMFLLDGREPKQCAFQTDSSAAYPVHRVSEGVMKKMATTDSPPPCLALVGRPSTTLENFLAEKPAVILVLDRLQDPGNFGTLVRSAVAFGADGVLTTSETVEAGNPKVIRGSAGLVFSIPVIETGMTLPELQTALKKAGVSLYFTTGNGERAVSFRKVSWRYPCALVLGSEGPGLSGEISLGEGDTWITVPMAKRANNRPVDSLNVAISGSLMLSEMLAEVGLKKSPQGGGSRN